MKVLDHGYVKLVEHWGADSRVIEAARMSTNKGFKGWGPFVVCNSCKAPWVRGRSCSECGCTDSKNVAGDERLLRYLYVNKHSSPFEMAGLVFEVKAPMFIFRQWHRHRTQSYNEMSGRYTQLPDESYIPSVERLMVNSDKNKQAGVIKGADRLTKEQAESFRSLLKKQYDSVQKIYDDALKSGVPKELARVHLPVGRYSVMRASANLRNWLGFLTLRMDEHAQWEIQEYARAVHQLCCEHFPQTMKLFDEGRNE
jgi:thymidylate synthase (FAD)